MSLLIAAWALEPMVVHLLLRCFTHSYAHVTCISSFTAWTDVDHTCYTIKTAGKEGFLVLLPIYVDHILNPLLTDDGFVTEVHHINGEGEDSGVVYSEMQGVECSGENKITTTMLKFVYLYLFMSNNLMLFVNFLFM